MKRTPVAAITTLFMFGALAPALAATGETIALVPLELSTDVNVSRTDLESAVMKGLALAGRPVVSPDEATARAKGKGELDCRTPACWTKLGAVLEAAYVVAGRAARSGEEFQVSIRLVRATDGASLGAEDNKCDVADCSLAELARRSARELVRQTLGDAPPKASPPPAAQVQVQETPALPPPPLWRKLLWPAVGVGAVAAGAGIYLITLQDTCVQKVPSTMECKDHWNTRNGGIAALAGGLALGATAAYFLITDGRTSVALGIGPGSISAAGRF